jgi:methylphosphotriester-DNA--protein-cysteine methyltransferase
MCVESLTYGALGARLNISPAAARALARRLQLPRSRSADGKALVSVDLTQIRHTPHPPVRRQPGEVAELTAQIAALRSDNAQLEAVSAGHRADFERERERAERLVSELLQATAETMAAREAAAAAWETAARLEGEVAVLRTRAQTDGSIDKTERRLGQLAATLVESDRKASRG